MTNCALLLPLGLWPGFIPAAACGALLDDAPAPAPTELCRGNGVIEMLGCPAIGFLDACFNKKLFD